MPPLRAMPPLNPKAFEEKYQKIERAPLGEGTYGEVYKVRRAVNYKFVKIGQGWRGHIVLLGSGRRGHTTRGRLFWVVLGGPQLRRRTCDEALTLPPMGADVSRLPHRPRSARLQSIFCRGRAERGRCGSRLTPDGMLQSVEVLGEHAATWRIKLQRNTKEISDFFAESSQSTGSAEEPARSGSSSTSSRAAPTSSGGLCSKLFGSGASSSTISSPPTSTGLVSTPFRLYNVLLGDFWLEIHPQPEKNTVQTLLRPSVQSLFRFFTQC